MTKAKNSGQKNILPHVSMWQHTDGMEERKMVGKQVYVVTYKEHWGHDRHVHVAILPQEPATKQVWLAPKSIMGHLMKHSSANVQ